MNKAKYVMFGLATGLCISLTVNVAVCELQRFKTTHTDKRLTLNERVTILEQEVKQLKEKKHGQMVK